MKKIFTLRLTSVFGVILVSAIVSLFQPVSPEAAIEPASLSMIYSNASDGDLPTVIFEGKKWSPAAGARFVKLHMYFDNAINGSSIEIDTCGTMLKNQVTMFINFDQWVMNLDQAENFYTMPESVRGEHKEDRLVVTFPEPQRRDIRSITINFEQNTNFSICGISLIDESGKPRKIQVPETVKGAVTASNTLQPDDAYNVMNLFDSRFEFGWATDAKPTGVDLDFSFDKTVKITKLKIWNGYQRSAVHCYGNSRPKTLDLQGDGGYKAQIQVQDIMGSQTIDLPKPFNGKKLKVTVSDAYLGKKYKDLVISELRFFNGKSWFMLDPSEQMQKVIGQVRGDFKKADLENILNNGLIGEAYNDKGSNFSRLRLRADGSFYISGYASSYQTEVQTNYFALGNFNVKKTGKDGIEIKIFGLYYKTEEVFYGDCNGCGRDCNKAEADNNQKIFSLSIRLSKGKNGDVVMQVVKEADSIKISGMNYKEE